MKTWQIIVLILGAVCVLGIFCVAGSLILPPATQTTITETIMVRSVEAIITATLEPTSPPPASATPTAFPTVTPPPFLSSTAPVSCTRPQAPEHGLVSKVTSGDSITVIVNEVPYSLRYIGVDTAKADQGSLEATAFNSNLVYGKRVTLYRDITEKDQNDRLLRYVFVGDTFVNLEMVKSGWATVSDSPPNTACLVVFEVAMQEAQLADQGIWAQPTQASRFEPTMVFLTGTCPQGCAAQSTGCNIKGNISNSGEKIYHMPGQQNYDDTIIDPAKGERWFCTEEEARANGWRKSKR